MKSKYELVEDYTFKTGQDTEDVFISFVVGYEKWYCVGGRKSHEIVTYWSNIPTPKIEKSKYKK